MLQVNDYIVYGRIGVCKIEDIGTLNLTGIDKKEVYYTIIPVYSEKSKLFIPAENLKIVMRKILIKEEALQLIDDIPNIEIIWTNNEREREEVYKEAVKKCDCRDWIRIIKTLNLKKQEHIAHGQKFTNSDKKYLQIAEESLYGELAVSLELPRDKVEKFIAERIC